MEKEIKEWVILEHHLIVLAELQDDAIRNNNKEESQRIWQDIMNAIKSFIRQEHQNWQKELAEKIGKMKKCEVGSENWIKEDRVIKIYNHAIEDIIELLK